MARKSAIVVGAGIVGLATATALCRRNYQVTVIEKNQRAIGASIRNFGMIWPIGQPDGTLYERACSSAGIWKSICKETGIWFDQRGSLHLAYSREELEVIYELSEIYRHRNYKMMSPREVLELSPAVVPEGLRGAMYSAAEMVVDPVWAISQLASWLEERFGVVFHWGNALIDIMYPMVRSGSGRYEADEIYVCNGADFETLYPSLFRAAPVTKSKLQMMRLAAQPANWRLGPSLCGGLSLLHYQSFRAAQSLAGLRRKFEKEMPEYLQFGIHVMVSQNAAGELTIGDSHEYGNEHDPFDRSFINQYILDYLGSFASFPVSELKQSWNGVYAKMTNGDSELVIHPEPGVTLINGLGGAGMTLSFGLCEELVAGSYKKRPHRNTV